MASRRATAMAATTPQRVNISDGERWASILAGGGLVLYGLRRASLAGAGLAAAGAALLYRGSTGHSRLYQAVGIKRSAGHGRLSLVPRASAITVERSVSIEKPAAELFRFWRNLENLPRFMRHVESVTPAGGGRSHWVARAPGGRTVEWDAEIVEERENELIAWRTLPGAAVEHSGSVRFHGAPGDRGTEVRVRLEYQAPGGTLGAALARLFGEEPGQQIDEDLRRFKAVTEAGEIPTVEGQPSGRPRSAKMKEAR